MSELLEQIESLKAQIENAQAMYAVTVRQRDNAWLEVERLENLIDRVERRLSAQTDFYQQRFNTLWTWVNNEVRPLSEDAANRYFAIVANGSPAPHEQADWRDTLHGLKLRAERAEQQRDSLVAVLARLFDWEDKSYAHAVMHVENAVNNLRADYAAALRREG